MQGCTYLKFPIAFSFPSAMLFASAHDSLRGRKPEQTGSLVRVRVHNPDRREKTVEGDVQDVEGALLRVPSLVNRIQNVQRDGVLHLRALPVDLGKILHERVSAFHTQVSLPNEKNADGKLRNAHFGEQDVLLVVSEIERDARNLRQRLARVQHRVLEPEQLLVARGWFAGGSGGGGCARGARASGLHRVCAREVDCARRRRAASARDDAGSPCSTHGMTRGARDGPQRRQAAVQRTQKAVDGRAGAAKEVPRVSSAANVRTERGEQKRLNSGWRLQTGEAGGNRKRCTRGGSNPRSKPGCARLSVSANPLSHDLKHFTYFHQNNSNISRMFPTFAKLSARQREKYKKSRIVSEY